MIYPISKCTLPHEPKRSFCQVPGTNLLQFGNYDMGGSYKITKAQDNDNGVLVCAENNYSLSQELYVRWLIFL